MKPRPHPLLYVLAAGALGANLYLFFLIFGIGLVVAPQGEQRLRPGNRASGHAPVQVHRERQRLIGKQQRE